MRDLATARDKCLVDDHLCRVKATIVVQHAWRHYKTCLAIENGDDYELVYHLVRDMDRSKFLALYRRPYRRLIGKFVEKGQVDTFCVRYKHSYILSLAVIVLWPMKCQELDELFKHGLTRYKVRGMINWAFWVFYERYYLPTVHPDRMQRQLDAQLSEPLPEIDQKIYDALQLYVFVYKYTTKDYIPHFVQMFQGEIPLPRTNVDRVDISNTIGRQSPSQVIEDIMNEMTGFMGRLNITP